MTGPWPPAPSSRRRPGRRLTRGRLAVAGLEAAGAVAARVPRRVAGRLCALGGTAWYLLAPAARAAVRDNLRHVLGREPSPRQVRAVFVSGARNYWDTLVIPRIPPQALLRAVRLHGTHHLDRALAEGRGAILVSPHLASVSLVAQALPLRGYDVLTLVEPIRPPEVFEFFTARRAARGARVLPVGPAALRALLTTLRQNGIVALITDRDVAGTGPVIDFFGAPTRFPDGAAVLAARTGAPILPAFAVLAADGVNEGWIEPPIPRPEVDDPREVARLLTRAVAGRLEYHIAAHPEQWTVFQPRWPDSP